MSLWKHQRAEIDQHAHAPARALFWEPRVGKTRTTVEQLKLLIFGTTRCSRALVVAPQMALKMTWASELAASNDWHVVDLSSGKVADRIDTLKRLAEGVVARGCAVPTIVLVNYDVLRPKALEPALLKWAPQIVIADEAHLIKSVSAERSRVMVKLGKKADYRRALTGTPTPRSYSDLFGIYKFLDPTIFGTSKKRFEDRYCIMHPQWRSKVLGYKRLPELEQNAFSIASRVRRSDCFDLPNVQEIERRIPLDGTAKTAYDRMVKTQVLEMAGLPHVDATHKLSRLVKLQKLTAGFITDDNDVAVWVHKNKIEAVLESLVDHVEAGEKVIISYYFRHEGAELERAIRERYGPIVERLSGQTPQRDREAFTAPFDVKLAARGDASRILVVQEAVGGLGISLAAADHMIFTSCSMDSASHSQMRDRIWSPAKKMTYTYLRSPQTVDYFVKRILATKDEASRMLLDVGFAEMANCDDMLESAA